jgi:methionyl-tRNA formyltransferase
MPLALDGNAEQIYLRANDLAVTMIERLIAEQPSPQPQQGEVVTFKRRRPAESEIKSPSSIDSFYDFIRMLDAEGYPRAFLRHEGFLFEFGDAVRSDNFIEARVRITPMANDQKEDVSTK